MKTKTMTIEMSSDDDHELMIMESMIRDTIYSEDAPDLQSVEISVDNSDDEDDDDDE